jgi:hypothetical protein
MPVAFRLGAATSAKCGGALVVVKSGYPVRIKLAIFLLLVAVLISGTSMMREIQFVSPSRLQADSVSSYQSRFEALRRVLPRHGLIGYLGEERDLAESATGEYHIAQYALVPLVLAFNDTELPIVVGNFHTAASRARAKTKLGSYHQADFGSGVILFQRP